MTDNPDFPFDARGRYKPERIEIPGDHFKGVNATACPTTISEHEVRSALEKQQGGNHYKSMPIQPVEFCQRNQLPTCEANVVKYMSRHRYKGGAQDVLKAIHYAELLLQMEYPEAYQAYISEKCNA